MADESHPDWITAELRRSAVSERAPAHLRLAIDGLSAQSARRRSRARPFNPLALIPGVGVLAAVIAALALVLPGGTPVSPTIARAATLGAHAARPGAAMNAYVGLFVRTTGGHFPDWRSNGGWTRVGVGVSEIDGHGLLTVNYHHGRELVAYSIAQAPLLRGQRAGFTSFTLGKRTVISWTEAGQSCLLSSVNVQRATLLALAHS